MRSLDRGRVCLEIAHLNYLAPGDHCEVIVQKPPLDAYCALILEIRKSVYLWVGRMVRFHGECSLSFFNYCPLETTVVKRSFGFSVGLYVFWSASAF